ncbi:hypothetical protein LTR85_011100 [Meristemomyces frigidus]|nr:hypothetical protein LTR85_011100 [Meristemomyces frigidus]
MASHTCLSIDFNRLAEPASVPRVNLAATKPTANCHHARACRHKCKDKAHCGHRCCKSPSIVISATDDADTREPTGREQVLQTTELVEAVLSFMPAIDVLRNCRGVCKQWDGVVEGSLILQKKLYFTADCQGQDIVYIIDKHAKSLTKAELSAVQGGEEFVRLYDYNQDIFGRSDETWGEGLFERACIKSRDVLTYSFNRNALDARSVPAHYTMRSMHITQPPVKTVTVTEPLFTFKKVSAIDSADWDRESWHGERTTVDPFSQTIRREEGVRMRDILDVFEQAAVSGKPVDLHHVTIRVEDGAFPTSSEWEKLRKTGVWVESEDEDPDIEIIRVCDDVNHEVEGEGRVLKKLDDESEDEGERDLGNDPNSPVSYHPDSVADYYR